MELNDILEKLSLPQDLTRRGFLKAASAAAALGLLNLNSRIADPYLY